MLHLGGKVYAWWLFESFALKNENNSSYAIFIRDLMEKFGGKKSETHVEKTNIPRKTKPLPVMEEFMGSRSLQKPLEEADILHGALLEVIPSSCILAQGVMEVSLSREDLVLEDLPTYVDEEKGNSAINHRANLVPNAEGGGAHDPIRGILASLQEGPQDLIHGGPSTISEQHDCAILKLEGGGGEKEQHHVMRGTHSS